MDNDSAMLDTRPDSSLARRAEELVADVSPPFLTNHSFRSHFFAVTIELEDGPEAYLLWHSTGLDVAGRRLGELSDETVHAVLASYPRLDFKSGFTDLVADQAERKPGCWAAVAMQRGLGKFIAAAPFES
jgi:hypothetical protein